MQKEQFGAVKNIRAWSFFPARMVVGNFLLLELHSCRNTRFGKRVNLVHMENVGVLLGHIRGGMGIGQGLSPGDILDGQVLEDVLFDGVLDCLFLQLVQELLKVVRMHVPNLVEGICRKGWYRPGCLLGRCLRCVGLMVGFPAADPHTRTSHVWRCHRKETFP